MSGWTSAINDKGEVHSAPINDEIEHKDEECPCEPTVEYITLDYGGFGVHFVHNAIDGRE